MTVGERKLVRLGTRTNASDVINLDHANVVSKDSFALTNLDLDAAGEFVLVEYNGTKWQIIAANATITTILSATLDVASVAANISAEQTFTIAGLLTTDIVVVNIPSTLDAGLGLVGARVSAADTLALLFMNATAGALDPASAVYEIYIVNRTK